MAGSRNWTSDDPVRAGRKALDIAQLCTLRPLPDPVINEFDAPLVALLQVAEASIRARVALRLAACSWAPREAVRMLAFEPLEISKPILARSPILTEDDLLELATEGEEHRLLIARRPRVSEAVSEAVAKYREARCLNALACNEGAELSGRSATDFADIAKADEELQTALARRTDMGTRLAEAIFAIAGETVRQAIAERYPELDGASLSEVVEEAISKPAPLENTSAALTEKLLAANTLTKADVLGSARHGRTEITDQAVAQITGVSVQDWQAGLSKSPLRGCLLAARAMAMCCREATLFYTSLAQFGRGHMLPPDALERACTEVFDTYARDDARRALHRLCADGSIS